MIKVRNFLAGIATLAITSSHQIWVTDTYCERLLIGILVYIALIIFADWISRFRRLDKKIRERIKNRKARRTVAQTRKTK